MPCLRAFQRDMLWRTFGNLVFSYAQVFSSSEVGVLRYTLLHWFFLRQGYTSLALSKGHHLDDYA